MRSVGCMAELFAAIKVVGPHSSGGGRARLMVACLEV